MTIRDRIKSLRRVRSDQLLPNPKNWNEHGPKQRAALTGALEEIGFTNAVIARETSDGLMLIDGHLRTEIASDTKIPVLVLDVTEEEADKLLATLDPPSVFEVARPKRSAEHPTMEPVESIMSQLKNSTNPE